VNLVGVIGAADAQWVSRRLDDFGVSSDGLSRMPGATGVTLSVSTREDRSFFTHVGVNKQLPQQLLTSDFLFMIKRARHVHFAMPLARSLATLLLPALAEAGCTSSLDVGYQPDWLTDAANHTTCREVDYLLPNEKEAALLSGAAAPEEYFSFARQAGLRHAVLKLGARGALANTDASERLAVSPPSVTAVDTTGAGDAFDAGFIDAQLDGAPLQECLRRACICGALSTRFPGALGGLPGRDELWNTYEQTYGT
jgi:sugar/nucleoside kinase (ribokinase family)